MMRREGGRVVIELTEDEFDLGIIYMSTVARHTFERLDSFIDAIVGKRLTYARLIAKVSA